MSRIERKDDAWVRYQNARVRRAKAEIAVIERRAAAEAAEADFDAAYRAETEASDAWRKAIDAERKTTEPTGMVPAGNPEGD
jgi:hypothetical protein